MVSLFLVKVTTPVNFMPAFGAVELNPSALARLLARLIRSLLALNVLHWETQGQNLPIHRAIQPMLSYMTPLDIPPAGSTLS